MPEVQLAERLHELGLLPEDKRRQFIKTVSNYAINGEDMFALRDEGIRAVFTEEEFDELVERARTRLLPRLGDVRREWESNHSSDDSPESYMQPLLDGLDALKDRFSDDDDAVKQIERQIQSHKRMDRRAPARRAREKSSKAGRCRNPRKASERSKHLRRHRRGRGFQ